MATCRRPALLRRCLDALLAQTLEPSRYEIVVVDDGRSEDTQALVDELSARTGGTPALRCLRPVSTRGPAGARNLGWRASEADVIAFTDDDTIPDPDWLANGARALQPEQVALAGRIEVPPLSSEGGRPTDHELMTRGFIPAGEFDVPVDGAVTADGFTWFDGQDAS